MRRRSRAGDWGRTSPRRWSGSHHLELCHHSVIFMLDYMAVEHVHTYVICELQLNLEGFARIQIPGFLHRFIGIARAAIATDTLLTDVMNVHRMWPACRICEDPFLGGAKDGSGIDPVWIVPQPIDRPMVRGPVEAPRTGHRRLADIRQRTQRWRDRAVVGQLLVDSELEQLLATERVC